VQNRALSCFAFEQHLFDATFTVVDDFLLVLLVWSMIITIQLRKCYAGSSIQSQSRMWCDGMNQTINHPIKTTYISFIYRGDYVTSTADVTGGGSIAWYATDQPTICGQKTIKSWLCRGCLQN